MTFTRFKKRWLAYTILSLVIMFIVVWIFAPILAKNYMNKNLANLEKYYGHVEDVDIALFKGGITTKNLYLFLRDAKKELSLKFVRVVAVRGK